MKSNEITEVITIHPEGDINVCSTFHADLSHSWTNVVDPLSDGNKHLISWIQWKCLFFFFKWETAAERVQLTFHMSNSQSLMVKVHNYTRYNTKTASSVTANLTHLNFLQDLIARNGVNVTNGVNFDSAKKVVKGFKYPSLCAGILAVMKQTKWTPPTQWRETKCSSSILENKQFVLRFWRQYQLV